MFYDLNSRISTKILKIFNFALMKTILYIHGMGGGSDSRIPSILKDALVSKDLDVVARTYDFDPEIASGQISAWVDEIKPSLIIGESLGSLHALRIKGLPHILISPALNTPYFFEALSWLTLIPGVTWIFDRIYKPREGDRQKLHFTFRVLRKYRAHNKAALANTPASGSKDAFHAFFGTEDHYRKSGVVSLTTWKKYFGGLFQTYEGTHYMEEEYIYSMLMPSILKALNINK